MQEFVACIAHGQRKPQFKFLQAFLPAILAARTLVLTSVGEAMAGEGMSGAEPEEVARRVDTVEHYLSRNLKSPFLDIAAVYERYLKMVSVITLRNDGEGVNVAVDGGDYAHPHARPAREYGMQGCSHVKDGSDSSKKARKGKDEKEPTVMGYPGITIEAATEDGNQVPLLHRLYTRKPPKGYLDPLTGKKAELSDPEVFFDGVTRVAPFVGRKAWWSLDSAFAGVEYRKRWEALGLRTITRTPIDGNHGKVLVRNADGFEVDLATLCRTTQLKYTFEDTEGNGSEQRPLIIRIGLAKVWTRNEASSSKVTFSTRPSTAVVIALNDYETRTLLLVNEWIEDTRELARIAHHEYRRRWRVEESHRLDKDDRRWGGAVEKTMMCVLVSTQRAVLFWMMVGGFLAWMRDQDRPGMLRLAGQAWAANKVPTNPRYRINKAVGEILARWIPKFFADLLHRPRPPPATDDEQEARRAALQRQIDNEERRLRKLRRELRLLGGTA